MKKNLITLFALTLFAGISAYAQQSPSLRVRDILDPTHSSTYDRNKIMDGKKESIEGSPYLTQKFDYGNIAGVDQLIMMRNALYESQVQLGFQMAKKKTGQYETMNTHARKTYFLAI